jgi:shikimate 5-dehydrogenase
MADSNAIMLVLASQSYRNIIIKTRSVLEEVSNVRESLSNLKVDLKKFHENCNIAKTVGMIHNVFGAGLTVGIIFKKIPS